MSVRVKSPKCCNIGAKWEVVMSQLAANGRNANRVCWLARLLLVITEIRAGVALVKPSFFRNKRANI